MMAVRVLVVDDDPDIREWVSDAVALHGDAAITAPDGAASLHVVDHEPVDLILLDMRMPVLDGWGFAAAYRKQAGEHAPVVCMTAEADVGRRSQDIGADGSLPKPFDLSQLFALLEHFGKAGN